MIENMSGGNGEIEGAIGIGIGVSGSATVGMVVRRRTF